jgi:soluble lytic murein transglycosylase
MLFFKNAYIKLIKRYNFHLCLLIIIGLLINSQCAVSQTNRIASTNDADAPIYLYNHTTDDAIFLELYQAAQQKNLNKVDQLSAELSPNHPLYNFGEYWRIKLRLPNVGDREIESFINTYSNQFVADRLRNDWLLLLGQRNDWQQFDKQLPLFVLADDPQVNCYAIASKAAQGNMSKEIARTTLFKNSSHLAGEGCMTAINLLYQTNYFNENDLWDAVHVLAEGKSSLAALRLADLLGVNSSDLKTAIQSPTIAVRNNRNPSALRQFALARAARIEQTISEPITPHMAIQGSASCAQQLNNTCNRWFKLNNLTGNTFIDLPLSLEGLGSDNTLEWSLRGALRAQDWDLMLYLIPRLPNHLKSDSTWIYWYAKALTYTNRADTARPFYQGIAPNDASSSSWGFYNILAQEALGLPLQLPAKPIIDENTVNAIFQRPEIARMEAFYRVGLRWEGNREWNWLVRGLSNEQLPHYAEAARRLNRLDRMISTADRAKGITVSDFTQRFPMPHFDMAEPIAASVGLDSHWVYGLMRQESRFITDVRSSVSARGLMQIMPATAAFVAKKIGLNGYTLDQLNDVETNLTLGHHYLAMVMNDLDQSAVLATAAYNAGPSRSKKWRASLNNPVEGAVFAETIPFDETRGYVKNVLANAVIYSTITGKPSRSLLSWLGTINPKSGTQTNLP